ncbi:metallophosphoesterase family protein [Consotaella salsifontis]|uniref:3',5'-cyclic AMP phosphodiesterase CpdA n=1 Tax=Consotaella salsifontis TaxID=1365950 RepID=A0A1T4NVD1_9HYPH|nr:metallophosphoesterase [Consotaella salsifontis]SJZ83310.1 3',5'-cyclic AMP phosphodiesterase CpdA [Consotaella salsifontis]
MFRLAHLSDIHLGPLPALSWRQLASKRIIGYVNWQQNRKRFMFGDTLISLVADLKNQHPDHICVTGDLVNLGTLQEAVAARAWLEDLGTPDRVSAIPGNHDAYVPGALKRSYGEWHDYMVGDSPLASVRGYFPYLRVRGPIAIIGLSSAEATAPFFATGTFKRRQAIAMARLLDDCRTTGHFRVVMIHHPPVPGAAAWAKRLHGKQMFSKIIREVGAELVLHGHTHLDTIYWLDGPNGRVPVVGVPSASQAPGTDKPAARYNIFEIEGEAGNWSLTQRERGHRESGQGVDWIRERAILDNGTTVNAKPRADARPAREPEQERPL